MRADTERSSELVVCVWLSQQSEASVGRAGPTGLEFQVTWLINKISYACSFLKCFTSGSRIEFKS